MRDRSPGPDQLVPNLPREGKVGQPAVAVVDVPEASSGEPVDGGWWNPKPGLARATPSRLLADTGSSQNLSLDRSQQFVVHGTPPPRIVLRPQDRTQKCRAHRAEVQLLACTFVRFARSPFEEVGLFARSCPACGSRVDGGENLTPP